MLAMSCAVTVVFRLTPSTIFACTSSSGHAERLGLGRDHAVDALALDDAGLDAVHAHLVRAGLGREALGEADHRPFRRGIRRAHRESRSRPATDDRLMMLPPPAALISGIALRVQ